MTEQAFQEKQVLPNPAAAEAALPKRPVYQGVVFHPRTKDSVSNEPGDQTSFYVNGANTNSCLIRNQAQHLADLSGAPVHLIENSSERPLRDYANVLRGARSSSWGMQAEPSCAQLMSAVRSELAKGREVYLHGFSQGGVIIQNALWEMAKTGEISGSFANRIHVRTYGSRVLGWPKGVVDVTEFSHSDDRGAGIIERATGKAGKPAHLLETKQPLSVLLPGRAHDFHLYLNEIPHFLSRSAKSGEELAEKIAHSITHGRFSDAVHREAIASGFRRYGKSFLNALEKQSQTSGDQKTIGCFALPSEAELAR